MANLEKVIKISKDDYSTLVSTGSITKGGVTYTYSDNDLYLVDGINDVVQLWSNSNPNTSFAAQSVTVNNLSSYKYIIFRYKFYYSSSSKNWVTQQMVCEYKTPGRFSLYGGNANDKTVASRLLNWTGNTITFTAAYVVSNGSSSAFSDNGFIIPVDIYGANDLITGVVKKDTSSLYRLDFEIQGLNSNGTIACELHCFTFITESVLNSKNSSIYTSANVLGEGKQYTGYKVSEFFRCFFPCAYEGTLSVTVNGYCQSGVDRPAYNVMLSDRSDTEIRMVSNNGWWYFASTESTTNPTILFKTRCTRVA